VSGYLLMSKKLDFVIGNSGAGVSDEVLEDRRHDEAGGREGHKAGIQNGLLGTAH